LKKEKAMNIQRPKKSINLLLTVLVMVFVVSCEAQKKTKVVEIFMGVQMVDKNYNYSDESVFKLDNIEYSLRSKAIYDTSGDIQQLIIYKPGGALEYNKLQLLEDENLMIYYDIPLHQSFTYAGGTILKSEEGKIDVIKITEDYLINKTGGDKVQFYKLK